MNEQINNLETDKALIDGTSLPLCHNCLEPHSPDANFCANCNTPVSGYASIGPIEHIWAQGALYRKAVTHPNKPMILWGMWMIFAPEILCYIMYIIHFSMKSENVLDSFSTFLKIFPGVFFLCAIVLQGVILFRVTKNYIRIKNEKKSKCPQSP
jgi:hypothetical protein